MIRNIFLPTFDTDFLQYPEVMRSRHQFNELMKQEEMVNKFFKQLVMRDPKKQVAAFGFNNIWTLSRTEMINIFEGMGNSMAFKVDPTLAQSKEAEESESILQTQWNHMLSLIFNNICWSIIDESPNQSMREMFYSQLNQNPALKIGFCWKEPGVTLTGSNICSRGTFETTATVTVDKKTWLIDGKKEGIILDPSQRDPDFYLIFARTEDFPQTSRPAYLVQQNVPFPGIVTIVIPKSSVAHFEDYEENGIGMRRIEFKDVLLPLDGCEVLPAEVDGVNAVNFKSFASLSMSALILGQMKSLMEEVNDFILCKKSARMGCEALDFIVSEMTKDLYTTESCIYYSAAMFDQLEKKANPEIHLESTLTSLITRENALTFVSNARTVFGVEKHDKFSRIINNITRLSSLLDEPNFNKVKIVLDGIEFLMETKGGYMNSFAVSPRLTEDNIGRRMPHLHSRIKRRHLMSEAFGPMSFRGLWDLQGYLHPQLGNEAPELERLLRFVNYSCEIFITGNYGKLEIDRHHDLMMIYDILKDAFKCLTCMARASRSMSETLRNAEVDIYMAQWIIYESKERIMNSVNDLEYVVTGRMNDFWAVNLSESFRLGGYYPQHALDSLTKDKRDLDNIVMKTEKLNM